MFSALTAGFLLAGCATVPDTTSPGAARKSHDPKTGSVIFIHPDGTSLTAWNALRILDRGPDGLTEWDRMPAVALYRPHVVDNLAPTSHAGGTVHGYGVKVIRDSYGKNGTNALVSASGKPHSVMIEALRAGLAVGIVNSGHLAEPGTGAMLASVDSRTSSSEIIRQLVESGCHVILGGGEVHFLPAGVIGRHGKPGVRGDKVDFVARARELGYTVVFTKEELAALPDRTPKVLGLFAAEATYNPLSEQKLRSEGLPAYDPAAPSSAEMARAALRFLGASGRRFFLMVEEEGTDDFANQLNSTGTFEAYRRADQLIGVGRRFVATHRDTLLVMASDSDASGLQTIAYGRADSPRAPQQLPRATDVGTPIHGVEGVGGQPYVSAPDREGRRFLFGVTFSTSADLYGGVVARAEGLGAERLAPNFDNTDIFRLIHATLFGSRWK